ncbi:MAG: MBL fold metallo-hydrolase [Cyanobacteria bacterium P01_E01_bin.6]
MSHQTPSITHSCLDSSQGNFLVKFWGVRGNIPSPGGNTAYYGGNTACVEVLVNGTRLIFDGGTGLRVLGEKLLDSAPSEAHLFFTHTHWDRIQGFPFFVPAFHPHNRFHIYGATGVNGASIKQSLMDQMLRPNFPVPLQMMKSELAFHNILPGAKLPVNDILVETMALHRPNGAMGYRATWNDYSVVYATDTNHTPDSPDEGMLYLAQQADVLIFDTTYGSHNYYDMAVANTSRSLHVWRQSVEAALTTQAKHIVMFHHAPSHDDEFLSTVEQEMKIDYPNVSMAREGMVINVCHALNPVPG